MSSNIFCIGELLIDMVCVDGKGLKNGEEFEKKLAELQQMLQHVFLN